MPGDSAADLALLTEALQRFGSAKALAQAYGGVKKNTPNEWLRRVRDGGTLSADKRRRLQELLSGAPAIANDLDEIPAAHRREYQRAVSLLRLIFKSGNARYRRGIMVNLDAISLAAGPGDGDGERAGPRGPRRVAPPERRRARRPG